MKILFKVLITAALLISFNAIASDWQYIAKGWNERFGTQTVYLEKNLAIQKDNFSTVVVLYNFDKEIDLVGGKKHLKFLSAIAKTQYNCAQSTTQTLSFTSYPLINGKGKPNNWGANNEKTIINDSETIDATLMKYVCDTSLKESLSNPHDGDFSN